MAITYDITKTTNQLFKERPNTTVKVKIDGVAHAWSIPNGGAFLASELARWGSEMEAISKIGGSGLDDDAETQFLQQFAKANDRMVSAFKAQVTSKDGSAEQWIDENISSADVVAKVISGLIQAINDAGAKK